MSAKTAERPKKSFEFRMCKKVAELTQVVHMLFTRNHEKEVEIEAIKSSYENEIKLVLGDAKSRITKLEETVKDVTNKARADLEQAKRHHEHEMSAKEVEWRQKYADQEKSLHEERLECQNLRDLLINAQRDIEKLRQGVNDQLASQTDQMTKRDKGMERLRSQIAASEAKIKEAQREAQAVISELEKSNEKLDAEVRSLHSLMESSHKTRDQLLNKNKQLETDMKHLKRDFNKRVSEMSSNQLKYSKSSGSGDTNEELERLRREVQRYRLELSNRDYNFNRMFTDKQPMVVNPRTGEARAQTSSSALVAAKQPSGAIYTFTPGSNNNQPSHVPPMSAGSLLHENHLQDPINGHNNTSLFPHGSAPHLLRDRHKTTNGFLDRQVSFHEKMNSHDRLFQSSEKGMASDGILKRPQTQSQLMHDRVFATRNSLTSNADEPSQVSPRKSSAVAPIEDRPSSGSLPSIRTTPTPEQRRLSKQLSKPKPLPREMLYGK